MRALAALMVLAIWGAAPALAGEEAEILDGDLLIKQIETVDGRGEVLRGHDGRRVKFSVKVDQIYPDEDDQYLPAVEMSGVDFDHPVFFTCRFRSDSPDLNRALESLVEKTAVTAVGTVKNTEYAFELTGCALAQGGDVPPEQ